TGRRGKRTRAGWTIESLNMKGRGAQSAAKSKWSEINSMMRERHIGILTLQETHLTEEYTDEIHQLFGKRLSVHFSACRSNSSGKAGVAIVLNKDLVPTDDVEITELVHGRAMLIQAPWHAGTLLTWLAIYAPNNEKESKEMWENLTRLWSDLKLPQLDGMSGDFNFVEDAIDRIPAHGDSQALVKAFQEFKGKRRLKDGWRHINPERREYTYTQMSGKFSRSRIDRIYVSDKVLKNSDRWEIRHPPIGTDHQIVSVRVTHDQAPYLGKGRWTMPLHLLNNKKVIQEVESIVEGMARDMHDAKGRRTDSWNPQTVYAKGKTEIIHTLHKYARKSLPVKKAKIEDLKAKLDETLQDSTLPESDRLLTAALLQQRIQSIQNEINESRRTSNMVKAKLEMETVSKYW
ncbi:Endonuclease/exonuclease/phosphatase, partial [Armillaria novae-zelandiae]